MTTKNNVTIKDLSYEYLKSLGPDFFESPAYLAHQELFDSLKEAAPLLADPAAKVGEEPPIVVEYTKKLLEWKYAEVEEPDDGDHEKAMMVFFYLQAKAKLTNTRKYRNKPILQVTSSPAQWANSGATRLRRVIAPISILRMRKALLTAPTTDPASSPAVRPKKTDSVVRDVVETSKFYQSVLSLDVYDDPTYTARVVRDHADQLGIPMGASGVTEEFTKGSDNSVYLYKYADFRNAVLAIRKALEERYFSKSSETVFGELNGDLLREALKANLRVSPRFREKLHRYVTIDTGPQEGHFIRGVTGDFVLTTIKESSSFPKDVNAHTAFQRTADGVWVLFSPWSNTTACAVDQCTNLRTVKDNGVYSVRVFKVQEDAYWEIHSEALDEGFVVQCFDERGQEIKPVYSQLKDADTLILRFERAISGKAYILKCVENWPGSQDIVVTDENVRNALGTFDFYRKEVKKWTT